MIGVKTLRQTNNASDNANENDSWELTITQDPQSFTIHSGFGVWFITFHNVSGGSQARHHFNLYEPTKKHHIKLLVDSEKLNEQIRPCSLSVSKQAMLESVSEVISTVSSKAILDATALGRRMWVIETMSCFVGPPPEKSGPLVLSMLASQHRPKRTNVVEEPRKKCQNTIWLDWISTKALLWSQHMLRLKSV